MTAMHSEPERRSQGYDHLEPVMTLKHETEPTPRCVTGGGHSIVLAGREMLSVEDGDKILLVGIFHCVMSVAIVTANVAGRHSLHCLHAGMRASCWWRASFMMSIGGGWQDLTLFGRSW